MVGDASTGLACAGPAGKPDYAVKGADPSLGSTLSEVPDVRGRVHASLERLSLARAVVRKNFPEVKDRHTTHRTSVLRLRSFLVQQPDRGSDAGVLAVPRQRHQP